MSEQPEVCTGPCSVVCNHCNTTLEKLASCIVELCPAKEAWTDPAVAGLSRQLVEIVGRDEKVVAKGLMSYKQMWDMVDVWCERAQESERLLNNAQTLIGKQEMELAEAQAERDAANRRADVNHESAVAYRLCAEEAGVNVYHVRDWVRDTKAELTMLRALVEEALPWTHNLLPLANSNWDARAREVVKEKS